MNVELILTSRHFSRDRQDLHETSASLATGEVNPAG